MSNLEVVPRDAATVMLVRDTPAFEVFMLRRNLDSVWIAGASVAADSELAVQLLQVFGRYLFHREVAQPAGPRQTHAGEGGRHAKQGD